MKNFKNLFTALLLLCATAVAAHDFEAGGIYYNVLSEENKTVEVTYKGTSSYEDSEYTGSVVIPESVTYNGTTYSVTSIEQWAFYNCTGLTSITIPNSVTSIENFAFRNCTELTSITIPNSVTSIGYHTFSGTAWYNNQPDGVVYAGKVLYKYKGTMPANTSITIKDGTLCIAGSAFYNCTGLTSITIPNSVTSIGEGAFYDCSGLTSIEIPNSVTSIGNYAFDDTAWYNNQPNGVVYAGKVLYKYKGTMPANTSITIKDGIISIRESAFSDCTGLTSITIPNSVTSIGNYAFGGCTGLTSITIPNSVTSIGEGAFYDCWGLTSIEIPNSVTSIGYEAFNGCTGLTSFEIPNSVTSIGERAFEDCTGLTSITIPNNVTSIGDAAFANCNNIFEIEIASKKAITASENVFSSDVYNNACLYVPEGQKFAYEKTAPWKNFHIVEKDFTGNDKMNGKK